MTTPDARARRLDEEERSSAVAGHHASLLSEYDLFLFNEGSHFRLFEHLGAHPMHVGGVTGTYFAVWAPNAQSVSVIGDFNGWSKGANALHPRGSSGVWEGFVPGVGQGESYKFHVVGRNGRGLDKADPFATHAETRPHTASKVWSLDYDWGDTEWMRSRGHRQRHGAPISIYEVHLGSWRRVPEDGNRPLSYREIAPLLVDHVLRLGFTHVELLPLTEYPFDGSWGYQTTGYFAPTSRFGTPQDFMYLVDQLHQAGIGVILDWVISHFPGDDHGLRGFDGTDLYEHADPRKGFHPDWQSYIFNYGRHEVRSFLISSALFWLSQYHIDGLRVDAVASMLYLDYSREDGAWIPNEYGGRENLEAISMLRRLNEAIYEAHPDVQTFAEESTAWPMVSRPTYLGGLGFGFKWDMGWMHDTLEYFAREPVHRAYHHQELTFRTLYAFNENFTLPLSHDEVAHGKGSLLSKMPGDDWQRFANLRLLYAYMYAQPGKKLLFMGAEIAQHDEWRHDGSLDWHLLAYERHQGVERLLSELNALYRGEPTLHELDDEPGGFEWVDGSDAQQSVFSFLRKDRAGRPMLAVFNMTPVPRHGHAIGVPTLGRYREVLNTDAQEYGGTGQGNLGGVTAREEPMHGRPASVELTLPPLGAVFLVLDG
jgi:1,4-alpha-glucan branching enzyme